MTPEAFKGVDVAIEFSNPEAATENLKRLAQLKTPSGHRHHWLARSSS